MPELMLGVLALSNLADWQEIPILNYHGSIKINNKAMELDPSEPEVHRIR